MKYIEGSLNNQILSCVADFPIVARSYRVYGFKILKTTLHTMLSGLGISNPSSGDIKKVIVFKNSSISVPRAMELSGGEGDYYMCDIPDQVLDTNGKLYITVNCYEVDSVTAQMTTDCRIIFSKKIDSPIQIFENGDSAEQAGTREQFDVISRIAQTIDAAELRTLASSATSASISAVAANVSAQAANSSAQVANSAAQSAMAAAQSANSAAQSANNAAQSANTSAQAANSAAQSAKNYLQSLEVTATTLSAGSSATVSKTTISGHELFTFGIPKGDTGEVANLRKLTLTINGISNEYNPGIQDKSVDLNCVTGFSGGNISGSIDSSGIATLTIPSNTIINGMITNSAITSAKISDGSIISSKISNNAIISSKISDSAIITAKISNANVTRAKLANDALISPLEKISSSRNLALSDLGKTLIYQWVDGNTPTTYTLTLNSSISQTFPLGYEVALCRLFNNSTGKITISNIRLWCNDSQTVNSGTSKTYTVNSGMIALKKLETHSTNGDLWLLTGSVEEG